MRSLEEFLECEIVPEAEGSTAYLDLADGIDFREYSWPKHGISGQELKRCVKNVKDYAYENYFKKLGIKDYTEELLKDTYIDYAMYACGWTVEKAEKELRSLLRQLKFSGTEKEVSQGWWHFVDWMIGQQRK